MIPKIIHYVWVGNADKPELVQRCIASWKKHLPDYQLIEWNNDSVKALNNTYMQQAFAAGQKDTQLTMNGQLFQQKTFKYQANTLNELRRKFSTVADTPELVSLLDKTGCTAFFLASK